ncbi:hypothetical protein [Synechococcus elongatus]|uniref:SH3 domain-containing protein n=1 Tax=Synechococcus elongatus PCC 11802 TaxID=2283154 RepID=A0AAT9K527_SYNEL|nr:hypothetical protein [Synechococcus elongatus]QFZ92450.1 hypothetical protein EKO22_08925 [Synechococcus elongatus PCC 11802]
MYDCDGHFDPMDDYFTEDEFYSDDPEAEERDRWPSAEQDPALEHPTPIQPTEKPNMAQAVSLASGIVKFTPGTPKDYGYGPRVNALVELNTGEEVRVYGNEGDPILLSLRKGQRVQLVKVKNSWTIAEPFAQSLPVGEAAQAAPAPHSIGREAQTAHALKTPEELANIWADAFKELQTQLPDAPPEVLGPAATSILINLTGGKRF